MPRGRKTGGFSLGMRQRLGLAAALLGDPPVLVLDEPANGLDPQGIRWLRGFLRGLAEQGRTVLVCSHVLPEVEQTADDVLVVARGRLVAQGPLAELQGADAGTTVRSPEAPRLVELLAEAGLPGSWSSRRRRCACRPRPSGSASWPRSTASCCTGWRRPAAGSRSCSCA